MDKEKHRIVRSALRKDLIGFGLPGIIIFFVGLVLSARDGYHGLTSALVRLAGDSGSARFLSAWNIAGLVMFVFGIKVAFIAFFTLKHNYSATLVIRKEHQLITHGVFRFVRHPIYFGVLIGAFGAPVYAPSLYGFLVMLLLVPVVLNRIRMEEGLLTEAFGDEYRKYSRRTKKLISFIY
jgi:protein-S-isoprenylcysteine O-methyltransferase Ste14